MSAPAVAGFTPQLDHSRTSRQRRAVPVWIRWAISICLVLCALAALTLWVREAVLRGPESDVGRQWRTAQYLRHGADPYAISGNLLRRHYGPAGELSLRKSRIYAMPLGATGPGVLPQYGAPEATYPPLTLLGVGLLPGNDLKILVAAANIVFLGLFLVLLLKVLGARWRLPGYAWTAIAAAAVMWPGTLDTFTRGQFGLLVLVCVLGGWWAAGRYPLTAGLLLSCALLKPSVGLPFLIQPLVERRWLVLASAAAAQAASFAAVAWMAHASPLSLLTEWAGVAQYFTQGAYTLQDIVNQLGWDNRPAGFALTLAFVALSIALAWRYRHAPALEMTVYLSMVSVLWTYHGRYDFVVLCIPLGYVAARSLANRRLAVQPALLLSAAGLLVVGIGLTDTVYFQPGAVYKAARYGARMAVWLLWLASLFTLRQASELAVAEGEPAEPVDVSAEPEASTAAA